MRKQKLMEITKTYLYSDAVEQQKHEAIMRKAGWDVTRSKDFGIRRDWRGEIEFTRESTYHFGFM